MTVRYGQIARMGDGNAMIKASSSAIEKNSQDDRFEAETPHHGGRRGRGADDRRTAILDAADQVFLDAGFQAASMSSIAALVGGSKGTLYNYFPSKEELFLACVTRHCDELQAQMAKLDTEGEDVRDTLTRLGQRYVEVVSSDDVVQKFRLVVSEADRAPEVARAFYETGPARGVETLARYLERAMREGRLASADPVRAARHFLGLCYNWLSKARLCNVASAPSRGDIKRDVDEAVRVFMAAYGPSHVR